MGEKDDYDSENSRRQLFRNNAQKNLSVTIILDRLVNC